MKKQILLTIFSVFFLGISLLLSTQQAQAFSCRKTTGGVTIERCCNQTGAACSAVFGAGWTGTCSDSNTSGICSSATYEYMCGPKADQQCVMPVGHVDGPTCKATRNHVTDDLTKILKVRGVNAPNDQPLENVNVTVWFNKDQVNQLNRYGDKLGDPAWGERDGDPEAGYTVYWTGKDNLENTGGGLGKDYELGYTTSALVTGKNTRGYNFGNVLQFLQIADKPELMKIRIKVQARSFKSTEGYYYNPVAKSCALMKELTGSHGFLLKDVCEAEYQRDCSGPEGGSCAVFPLANGGAPVVGFANYCAPGDDTCINARPDDWRKGTRSTWRNMVTLYDQKIDFGRYECYDGPKNLGNSKYTLKCLAEEGNQCSADNLVNAKFRLRLSNIVQPLALTPGATTTFRMGFGWDSTGADLDGDYQYDWSEADKMAIRSFIGTPHYEGWYDEKIIDGAVTHPVICQRWNWDTINGSSVGVLDCPNKEKLQYRFLYQIDAVGQYTSLSRFIDISGGTPFQIPENRNRKDCTQAEVVSGVTSTSTECKITLASLSEFFKERGWYDRYTSFGTGITVPITMPGQTDPYWVTHENTGVDMVSLNPAALCDNCEQPPLQCKPPTLITSMYTFKRSGGSFEPIDLVWYHNAKDDTSTKTFTLTVGGLSAIPPIAIKPEESDRVEYKHRLTPADVDKVFNYMQSNDLKNIPFEVTARPAAGDTDPTHVCKGQGKLLTETRYGCNQNGACVPQVAGEYATNDCNNACEPPSPKFYGCNEKDQCVLMDEGGTFTTDNCNDTCPKTTTYGCNSTGQCVERKAGIHTTGNYTSSNCNNACPTEKKYGCSTETGACVEMATGGTHTTSDCDATCPSQQTYGCNEAGACVEKAGGVTDPNCFNACKPPIPSCDPTVESCETCQGDCAVGVALSFVYTADASTCSTSTPPRSLVGRYGIDHDATTTDPQINLGQTLAFTQPIEVPDLKKASVRYDNPAYFCNACSTSGNFTGLCSAPFVKKDEGFEARVVVRDISSLLNSWWQSVGGRTYGAVVRSAVPGEEATSLLPDFTPATHDQFLTRSPQWTRSRLGGFLLSNVINFKSPATPMGVPSFWLSEQPPASVGYAETLLTDFQSSTLPLREGSMYKYFTFELERVSLERPDQTWTQIPPATIPPANLVDDAGGPIAVLKVNGNLRLEPTATITIAAGQKIIVLVNGNVDIRGTATEVANIVKPIQVANGGFFMIVASGNITVDSNVGESIALANDVGTPPTIEHSSQNSTNKTSLEGIYLADGQIIIENNGDDSRPDKRFVGSGIFVGKDSIQLQRKFSKKDMPIEQQINGRYLYGWTPTEIFHHRTDLVSNTPNILNVSLERYQEVE